MSVMNTQGGAAQAQTGIPPPTTASPEQTPRFSPEPFWEQHSTRWDVLKFLIPLALCVIWALIQMYFGQIAQTRDIATEASQIATFQNAKENRGERLSVVEAQVRQQNADIAEIKDSLKEQRGDIKTLLSRSAK